MNKDFKAAKAPKYPLPKPPKNIGGIITAVIVIASIVLSGILLWKNSIQRPPENNVNENFEQPKTITLNVYFDNSQFNPNAQDCQKVFPVKRELLKTLPTTTAALNQLFAGPTAEEKNQGYSSWFSAVTKDILISINILDNTAYVNLKDLRQIIPNASSSCGSAELLAEIENTLKQFPAIKNVVLGIEGKSNPFYEWLQLGCETCDDSKFLEDNGSDKRKKIN